MGVKKDEGVLGSVWREASLLLFIALGVRLIALARIFLISRDGIHYVALAKLYGAGEWLMGLGHPYHPLYPVLTGWVGKETGNYELAGHLVSLVLGSATVIALYLIGKTLYGRRVGFIAGLLFAFQPYCVRFSVDVLSDSTFLFFFILALSLGLCAGFEEKKGFWLSLAAGVSGGLAYLTRPEGAFVMLLLAGWYSWRFVSAKRGRANLTVCAVALALSFLLVACPYLLFLKSSAGSWQLSAKPSVLKAFFSSDRGEAGVPAVPPHPVPAEGTSRTLAPTKAREVPKSTGVGESLAYPPLKFIETFHFLLFVFLLLGVGANDKRGIRNYKGILFLGGLAYLVCLSYLFHVAGYVSRRHFLPPIALSLPIAAQGFWALRERFFAWKPAARGPTWGVAFSRQATVVLTVLTIATLAPKALSSQGADKLPLKEAGFWIKEHGRKPPLVVMCNEPLVAYYAGGSHIYLPGLGYDEFVTYVKRTNVDYLVFGEKDLGSARAFVAQLEPGVFRKAQVQGDKVLIYEVRRER